MALVRWNKMCQPKSCEGIRIRRLCDQNKAFMMKLSYNIVIKLMPYGCGFSKQIIEQKRTCQFA